MTEGATADRHPFLTNPHRTFVGLSVPVLLSLIAEPVTGLVDTAFIAQLGAEPLAALGAATVFLSSIFWVFNFLSIGTQTEVAQADGAGDKGFARRAATAAIALSVMIGVGLALLLWPFLDRAAVIMGADGAMVGPTVTYLGIRILGSPATLILAAGFGVLRGLQLMRIPLMVSVAANGLNLVLDPILIWGFGPVPGFGIAGAAWASTVSHWLAALWVVGEVARRVGFSRRVSFVLMRRFLVVGRDLAIRTGTLTFYLLLATRWATSMGASVGAAHQVIRQFWILTALFLDAYSATAQSLVGFFLGAARKDVAKKVADIAALWAVSSGVVLAVVMALGTAVVQKIMVPESSHAVFVGAWLIAALFLPINAVGFVTDGIHWGTKDFAFLRNASLAATGIGIIGLLVMGSSLNLIWLVTGLWVVVRASLGALRIWPGFGNAPLNSSGAVH